ncbi:ABC transporter ATP-binding protein [Salarchaeum japonicum]|uniref:ABC transporter ATP-binding protein n=1 Tax=Salarchaeum japonicum TaxID=555573 RepID=UPI003C7913F9
MSQTHATDSTDERTTEETPDAKLRANELELRYASVGEPVVDCDTLVIPEGEITALVGPNGSGKSTLLRGLARHLAPADGDIVLDGRDIADLGDKEFARELGLLSQENNAPGGLTVEDLVHHGRYPHKGFFDGRTSDDEDAVERALSLTGIEHLRDDDLGNLSGGQKQLVWIAMTLAQQTDTILLDEPTTYLDLHHQLRVMDVIHELNEERGATVCVVLHDLQQAARFADYLVALRDGKVYDWGPPEDVVTEELLADVFGVDAAVDFDDGDPRILPRQALDR